MKEAAAHQSWLMRGFYFFETIYMKIRERY